MPEKTIGRGASSRFLDGRSFKEVVVNGPLPCQNIEGPNLDISGEKLPSLAHLHDELRNERGKIDGDCVDTGTKSLVLDVDIPDSNMEWLNRSMVGKIKVGFSCNIVQESLLLHEISVIVCPFNEDNILLTFPSIEDLMVRLSSQKDLLDKWFESLVSWAEFNEKRKFTSWIWLEEVPLELWHVNFFMALCNLWGSFLNIREHTLNRWNSEAAWIRVKEIEVDSSETSNNFNIASKELNLTHGNVKSGFNVTDQVVEDEMADAKLGPSNTNGFSNSGLKDSGLGFVGDFGSVGLGANLGPSQDSISHISPTPTDGAWQKGKASKKGINFLPLRKNSKESLLRIRIRVCVLLLVSQGLQMRIRRTHLISPREEEAVEMGVNGRVALASIYAPNVDAERSSFLISLSEVIVQNNVLWCVCGDFNAVTCSDERIGASYSVNSAQTLVDFIQNCNLVDLPLQGIVFGIDRKNWGPKPFRYFNHWKYDDNCKEAVHEAWSKAYETYASNANIPMMLREVKTGLKEWRKRYGANDSNDIKKIELEIQTLKVEWEEDLDNQDLRNEIIKRKGDMWKLYKAEERSWFQKSRFQWL
ncbi:hypothetical protein CCACVL1_30099 [Corchorus capsularis]|uniref:Endonuclease/exonuclease/phosphatase n=1 Tax=Corchorus capsularis TaxID=210143 RepID=A0A1R3FYN4_COCAP|nr:hypothetical protein CCACVL1_30099 [Corchorus capsularis]